MRKSNYETRITDQQLRKELKRTAMRDKRWAAVRRSLSAVIVLVALFVITTAIWFPVYHVTGRSMEPNLLQGQVVVAYRTDDFRRGDIAALYYENNIMIRRVIGLPGDLVEIDQQGSVSVNREIMEEPYLEESAPGTTDLVYPYQVPDDCYFVMGDNRSAAADSRMSFIGCIDQDKTAGRVFLCVWPISQAGYIE